jgi:hypothetical protein
VTVQSTAGIGTFYGGRFDVKEIDGAGVKPILVMRLVGGNFKGKCATAARTTAGLNTQAKKTPVRRLWGKGKGKFRTKGRYASAAIRGTWWLTADYCTRTLVQVKEGTMTVADIPKKKTVIVKAPKSYSASPKK